MGFVDPNSSVVSSHQHSPKLGKLIEKKFILVPGFEDERPRDLINYGLPFIAKWMELGKRIILHEIT